MPGEEHLFEKIRPKGLRLPSEVLEATLELAIEIAREGREGRRIGTMFTLGHADRVLASSRPLILDPIALHPRELRRISDPDLRGTLKELAQLDGAFVVDDEGVVVAACRHLDTHGRDVEVGLGLGSRHLAAASVSRTTGALAVVVSESAIVRLYVDGHLHAEVLPELWLLSRHSSHLRGPVHEAHVQDLAVFTTEESSRGNDRDAPPGSPRSR